jgi:hypothetical protein
MPEIGFLSGASGAGSLSHRETINRLWDVLGDAHLNKALGLPPNTFGPYLSRR